ncbi:four helix bundle protein [Virgibacillus flavescens]|uniref:four helix bundle protein n=1 Tax=Virgibacillus flavescens TaxID=1611422 RepID=UPI003D34050D
MRVENFRKYTLYDRSLDLMIAIYRLIDNYALDPDDRQAKELYRCAIKIPKLIASGIGQTNMNVRIKRLNMAKEKLEYLQGAIRFYEKQRHIDNQYLDEIEDNRIQVIKLMNGYFGWLKEGC